MNSLDFCFWLRGHFELNGEKAMTKEQAELISKHLAAVFAEEAKHLPPLSKTAMQNVVEDRKKEVVGVPKPASVKKNEQIGIQRGSWVDLVPGVYSTVDSLVNDFHKAMDKLERKDPTFKPTVTVSCSSHKGVC